LLHLANLPRAHRLLRSPLVHITHFTIAHLASEPRAKTSDPHRRLTGLRGPAFLGMGQLEVEQPAVVVGDPEITA
jgi:hypothetical protein